jgi:outer membrane protein
MQFPVSYHRPLLLALWATLLFPAVTFAAPLTLDEAVRLALEHNPTIKVDHYSRGIARANLLAAYGHFDPVLTFQRSRSDSENPPSNTPTDLIPTITRVKTDDYSLSLDGVMPWGLNYSLGTQAQNQRGTFNGFTDNFTTFGGVSVTQPLLRDFGFGANLNGVRLAKADRGISDWDYRQTVIDTVTRVIFAYNDLAFAEENLVIARRARELAQTLLTENEKRSRAGAMSQSDVIEARARAAQREEAILIAEEDVKEATNQLRELLGEEIFNQGPLEIAKLPAAPNISVTAAEDFKIALTSRPDYQATRLGVQKSRINASYAINQMLPRVDFVGSYGYAGADQSFAVSRAQVRNEDNAAWSAGMVVKVPLTFAEGRGRARAARLQRDQAEASLASLEQDIAVQVANAAGQIETTQKRVVAAQEAYDLGTQSLDAEEKKLKAGTSSTFVVLQFQETLTELESRLSLAHTDHRKALANYDRTLGRTLEKLNITIAKQ